MEDAEVYLTHPVMLEYFKCFQRRQLVNVGVAVTMFNVVITTVLTMFGYY